MKVLLDYHHHDLWESMELLCARLGWELYRPMGMEWWDEGYWNLERAYRTAHNMYPIDAVARQYLEPWGSDIPTFHEDGGSDKFGPTVTPNDGRTLRWEKSHARYIKLLTLEAARDLKPDIVIASVAHNHEGFHRFATEVGATFGLQLGNVRFSEIDMREDRWDLAKFGLLTTLLPGPVPVPSVVYHQEFNLDDFRYEPPVRHDGLRVASFVNCFAENVPGYEQFLQTARALPEFDWQVYGSYGSVPEDQYACGNISVCADVASAMRASDIGWHTKIWSDGFGHVIHNWFAVGRPVFGYEWYYKSQLAGPLWQDGVTSYDLTNRSVEETASLLRMLRDNPDRHEEMCEAAARRFREIVNFDEEEQAIRRMFEQVL